MHCNKHNDRNAKTTKWGKIKAFWDCELGHTLGVVTLELSLEISTGSSQEGKGWWEKTSVFKALKWESMGCLSTTQLCGQPHCLLSSIKLWDIAKEKTGPLTNQQAGGWTFMVHLLLHPKTLPNLLGRGSKKIIIWWSQCNSFPCSISKSFTEYIYEG